MLKKAGITAIAVPSVNQSAWKGEHGITVEPVILTEYIKLLTPSVKTRANVASATRSPWVDTNGWRLIRDRGKRFLYDAPGKAAALAVAEAFVYSADALVRTDAGGL